MCYTQHLAKDKDSLWETQMAIVYDGFSYRSKAEERCRSALKSDKKSWRPLLLLAKLVESDTEAIKILKSLMKQYEGNPLWMKQHEQSFSEMAFILGNRNWNQGLFDKALENFSQCIRHDPTNHTFIKEILAKYQDSDRWDGVIGLLEQMRSQSQLSPMAISLADSQRLHVIILRAVIATEKYHMLDQVYLEAINSATEDKKYNAAFYLHESYAGALAVLPDLPLDKITNLLEKAAKEVIPYTTLDPTAAFFRVGYRLGRIYLDKAIEAKNAGNVELAAKHLRQMSRIVPEQVNEDQMRLPLRLFSARYYIQQRDLPKAQQMAHNTLQMAIELLSDEDDSNDTLAYTKILYAVIPFGDEKNVAAALAMLKVSEGDQFFIRCSCKCESGWFTPGDMWWCMDCINMVLTPECYKKVKSGQFFNNICHKYHNHLYVPEWSNERMERLPRKHIPWGNGSLSVEDWKKQIINSYNLVKSKR